MRAVGEAPWRTSQSYDDGSHVARRRDHPKKKQFRASERDRPDVIAARQAFVAWLKTIALSKVIFIDETGCNVKMTPEYGWAVRGERLVDRRPACHGKNLTVVGAIREDRVLCHDKFEGTLNGDRWRQFVKKTLCPKIYPGDIVVVDNLRVHKDAEALALIRAEGAKVKFLPPYSPDLNPIELCWAFLKHQLRRLRERTIGGLRRGVWRGLMRVTGRHLRAWFRESCVNPQPN